jgi:tRNA(Phe) wybutosine-synthesizing methylase Tyw3
MADWEIARYHDDYHEKIDTEILGLCDILNEAGFETTRSCCGHGVFIASLYISQYG